MYFVSKQDVKGPDCLTASHSAIQHCNIWNSQPYLNPIACLLTLFTWPFVSRRVCGKIYRLGREDLLGKIDVLKHHVGEE